MDVLRPCSSLCFQVIPACEIDNSSLDSISEPTASAAQMSLVASTVSLVSSSDQSGTPQFGSENSQSIHITEGKTATSSSNATMTHFASGMSSSMMDFFSRHNVLIIDSDNKENVHECCETPLSSSEVESTDTDNIYKALPAVVTTEMPKDTSDSEIPAEMAIGLFPEGSPCAENFSTFTEVSDETGIISSLPPSITESEVDACNISKLSGPKLSFQNRREGRVIPIQLVSESESEQDTSLESQTHIIEASDVESGSAIEVIYHVDDSIQKEKASLVMPGKLASENKDKTVEPEVHDRKISTASQEIDFAAGEVASSFEVISDPPKSFAYKRQTSETAQESFSDQIVMISQMVQISDDTVGRTLRNNGEHSHDENADKSSAIMKELSFPEVQDVLKRIDSQSEKNSREGKPSVKVLVSDLKGNIDSAKASDRKLSIASEDYEFAPEEATSSISTPVLQNEAVSFLSETTSERAVSSGIVQMEDLSSEGPSAVSVTATQICGPADKEDSQDVAKNTNNESNFKRKLSKGERNVEICILEVTEALATGAMDVPAFAWEQDVSGVAEESLKEAILVTPQTVLGGSVESSQKLVIDAAEEKEASIHRKLSVADKSFEITPLEVSGVLATAGVDTPSFAWKQSVAEIARESLKEAVVVTPQTALGGSGNPVEKEICLNRKVSTAESKLEIIPIEVSNVMGKVCTDTQAFVDEKVVAEVGKENLQEAVVLMPQSALGGSSEEYLEFQKDADSEYKKPASEMEITSEISEESIPLGGEAALIGPSNSVGCEGYSLSGEGNEMDMSIDEIAFVQGFKSAIPTGYTYRSIIAEEDTMSEALSYYDMEASVNVKDRYGVAVTVTGTLAGLEEPEGDDDGKQIPFEEGGLEGIKIEPSHDSILKSSRKSSRGGSLENLLEKLNSDEIDSTKNVTSLNRVTFLTEVYHEAKPDNIQDAGNEIQGDYEVEIPFESVKQTRKQNINLDSLKNVEPLADMGRELKLVEVKKTKVELVDQNMKETKLQYLPYKPPSIKYGPAAPRGVISDDQDHKIVEEKIIKVSYIPHVPPHTEDIEKENLIQQSVECELEEHSRVNVENKITESKDFRENPESEGDSEPPEMPSVTKEMHYPVDLPTKIEKVTRSVVKDSKISYVPHVPIENVQIEESSSDSSAMKGTVPTQYVPCVLTGKVLETESCFNEEMSETNEIQSSSVTSSSKKSSMLVDSSIVEKNSTSSTDMKEEILEDSSISEATKGVATETKPLVFTSSSDKEKEIIGSKVGPVSPREKKIHYVPHAPIPEDAVLETPISVPLQIQRETVYTSVERVLHSVKETEITSDDEICSKEVPAKTKKTTDMEIDYIPAIPVDIVDKQIVSDSQQSSVSKAQPPSKPQKKQVDVGDSKSKTVAEVQIHVAASKEKEVRLGENVSSEKMSSQSIHYVPCAEIDTGKLSSVSPAGARPKEIHYVPHSPADLANYVPEEHPKKYPLPSVSVIVTSPSSSDFELLKSGSSDLIETLVSTLPSYSSQGVVHGTDINSCFQLKFLSAL